LFCASKSCGDGFIGDGDKLRIELKVSSLWPARRRLCIDGRWSLGSEQRTLSAAPRATEQPFSGSALLTSHEEGPRKGGLNIACSINPGQVTAPVRASQPCGRNHRKQNYHIAVWNVRTLLNAESSRFVEDSRPPRRTALFAAELNRYKVDIAALSETRLAEEGSLSEVGKDYTFFWKGLPENSRRIHCVGLRFALRYCLVFLNRHQPSAKDS